METQGTDLDSKQNCFLFRFLPQTKFYVQTTWSYHQTSAVKPKKSTNEASRSPHSLATDRARSDIQLGVRRGASPWSSLGPAKTVGAGVGRSKKRPKQEMSCNLTESQKKIEKHETYQVQRRSLESVACLFRNEAVDIIKRILKKC